MGKRMHGITLIVVFLTAGCGLKRAGERSDYHFRNTTLNHDPHPYQSRARWGDKKNATQKKPTLLAKLTPLKRVDPKHGLTKEPKVLVYPTTVPTPTKVPNKLVPSGPKTVVTPTPAPKIERFSLPPGDANALRQKVIASAVKRIGQSGSNPAIFIIDVLKENRVSVPTTGNGTAIQGMYYALKRRKQVYDKDLPRPGDLVFFHNTADTNKDNRNNDWYSLIGIVEKIDADSTVSFVALHFGKIQRLSMNLKSPQVRRNEKKGKVINAFLRIKRMDDPEYTQYLAGELYAGFGTLFKDSDLVSRR